MDKATFLSKGIKTKKVHIEAIDLDVFIRPMSYAAMAALSKCNDHQERTLVTVLYCLVDESGLPLFKEEERDELANAMSFDTIREIANEVVLTTTASDSDLVK